MGVDKRNIAADVETFVRMVQIVAMFVVSFDVVRSLNESPVRFAKIYGTAEKNVKLNYANIFSQWVHVENVLMIAIRKLAVLLVSVKSRANRLVSLIGSIFLSEIPKFLSASVSAGT